MLPRSNFIVGPTNPTLPIGGLIVRHWLFWKREEGTISIVEAVMEVVNTVHTATLLKLVKKKENCSSCPIFPFIQVLSLTFDNERFI